MQRILVWFYFHAHDSVSISEDFALGTDIFGSIGSAIFRSFICINLEFGF